ncbi:ASCH domain-containing protein [Geodermatophilus sp. YIM 151500]|uniref:ASCH domain-containing protein n=1 Tax=Geodermatophilus sp. YIM 151500 TaxID=2984531 RepID=UPI0021E3F164|nr:ASCH domain-containing protein [Geodermatophilus sp. YIM 151500]MCV2490745.1 ASCH domain-containing protein [Geodermatophilus sp. YIM 151500]
MPETPPRTPLAPPDAAAAEEMWTAYAAAHPEAAAGAEHVVEQFGDSAELAEELIGLVLHGPKRATAALVADFVGEGQPLPRIGGHWIACDGAGVPRAVLRTTELRLGPIGSVDDAFARDEGEGDRTRADWLAGHRRYFERTCAARGERFTDDQDVVFERFRVVWPPGPAG